MRSRLRPGRGEAVGPRLGRCDNRTTRGFNRDLRRGDRIVGLEAVEIDDELALLENGHELERARGCFHARDRPHLGHGLGLVGVVMALVRSRAADHAQHGDEDRPEERQKLCHDEALGRSLGTRVFPRPQ